MDQGQDATCTGWACAIFLQRRRNVRQWSVCRMTINQAAAVGALKQTKSQLPESKKEKNPMYQKTCYGFLNQGVFETAHRPPSWVGSEVWNTEAALLAHLLVGEHVLIFDRIIDALLLQRALDPPPHENRYHLASAFSEYILIFTFICF